MEALQTEIWGWLGYLDRWSVTWQIMFILVIALATPITRRSRPLLDNHQALAIALGPLTLLGTGLLLKFLPIPSEIILRVGSFWILLSLINWIEQTLKIKNPRNQLAILLGVIARPAILISAIIYFIDRLGSLSAIDVISVGKLFNNDLLIGDVFKLAVGFYLILATRQTLAVITAHLMQFIFRFSDRNRKIFQPYLGYLIITIGSIALALYAGFNSSTLLVISGTIGLGLGVALKDPFLNFITGVWLLLEGSIKPGEILMIDNEPCRVKQLNLRAAILWRQRDEAELLIPNHILFSTRAETFTAGENNRRESIVIGAAYHHNPQHIIALLEEIAQTHKRVLHKPMPEAHTTDFADSAITYVLKFSVRTPLEALQVASELRQQIWTAFEENDITIPFPQRQVYPMEWPPKDKTTLRQERPEQ